MKYVFKELFRHRWRTVLSITGFSVATLFMMVILSVSGSNRNDSFGILQSTGTHFIVYIPTDSTCCSNCMGTGTVVAEGVKTMLMDNEMISTIKDVRGVRDAAPCILYKMYNDRFMEEITISGIDTTSIATFANVCSRTNLVAGKFLSDKPDELVAEQSFATAHRLSLGDTLDVFGGRMVIAGIVNSGIKPVKADFYAPIANVRTIMKEKLFCTAPYMDMNIILVEVTDARIQDEAMEEIKNMMYRFAVSSYNCYEPAYRVMNILEKSSASLTILIFIFLIVISAKTQLTALVERFKEIGILKSLGWSDADLSANVLVISLIQAVMGVTIGLFTGFVLLKILQLYGTSIVVSVDLNFFSDNIPLIYFLCITGAAVASFFPIIKIFRTKPGDIIKYYP